MREILFRGKRTDNGEWVEGLLWKKKYNTNKFFISCFPDKDDNEEVFVVRPETIGQYTGLTDKNGKKIFEGDIIKTITNSFDRDKFVTEIKFGARSGVQGFHLANGRMMFYFGQKDLTVMDDTEVIGNIHDIPELLKGGEG